jgi:hypothetical protein
VKKIQKARSLVVVHPLAPLLGGLQLLAVAGLALEETVKLFVFFFKKNPILLQAPSSLRRMENLLRLLELGPQAVDLLAQTQIQEILLHHHPLQVGLSGTIVLQMVMETLFLTTLTLEFQM